MQIGLHVSISGSIANAVTNAVERECSAFQIFTGNPSDIVSDIESFRDVGLDTMIFRMERPSLAGTLDLIEWFGSEIRPLL